MRADPFAWIADRLGRLVVLTMGVGLIVAGIYLQVSAALARHPADVTAAALERGEAPSRRHVRLLGKAMRNDAVELPSANGSTIVTYVPVVSESWRPQQPVRAYFATDKPIAQSNGWVPMRAVYTGVAARGGLPAAALTAFGAKGMAAADSYWVVDLRASPDGGKSTGLALVIVGFLICVAVVVIWLVSHDSPPPNLDLLDLDS